MTPNQTSVTKRCSRCNELKPLTDFHLDRATTSGYQGWCKPCARQRDRDRPRRRQTPRRILRVRAHNRALLQLKRLHEEEFARIFTEELANAIEQADLHRGWVPDQMEEHAGDAAELVPLLLPGPAVAAEPPENRIRHDKIGGCLACERHHRRGHACPSCGTRPQIMLQVDRTPTRRQPRLESTA